MSKLAVTLGGHTFEIEVKWIPPDGKSFAVVANGETVLVTIPAANRPAADLEWVIVNDRPYELVYDSELRWIRSYSGIHRLEVRDMEATFARPPSGDGRVKAPIPGLITRVVAAVGDQVQVGQPLLVLEAMKMENEIRSPAAGTVVSLHVQAGQSVVRGEVMAEIQ